MGGNARGTNKVTGVDTLAQKIPLKEIGRSRFIKKFIEIFEEIDKRFEREYKRPLWTNKSILKNGVAFNGSTSFIMNPEIPDDQVVPFKPTSGDLDIMVKSSDKADLWTLLDSFESSPNIMPDVEYMGSNKRTISSIGEQINCVFKVIFGDIVTYSQVDWEFTEFEGEGESEAPMEYSRFGHSSSLFDAQQGFKGVVHKYILRSLAGGASLRTDVLILTSKATYEKPAFKKTKGAHITELRMDKFFVSRGLRKAYQPQFTPDGKPWIVDGKRVYKETPASDSNYETSVKEIFKILFNDMDSGEVDKMWSFVGIVSLMKKHLDKRSINDTFERFLDICWGYGGQKLERDDKSIDMQIKANAVNYLMKEIPGLKKYEKKIQEMTDRFYADYEKKIISEAEIHYGGFKGLLETLK